MKKTPENRAARKRGLAPRSLLEAEGRRSALESLERPVGTAAAAFVRAALEAAAPALAPAPAPAPPREPAPALDVAPAAPAGPAPAQAAPAPAQSPAAAAADDPPARQAAGERTLRAVPLAEIDLGRRRFQYRVSRSLARLQESLLLQGQQVPVILRGARAPYEIVSGFGRCEALAALVAQGKLEDGRVWADVRADLSDREAHEISVLENEEREGLSDLDRINKARLLRDEGYAIAEIATVLKKGERMVQYYLSLSEAPRRISEALARGTLRPTHALVLTKFARDALAELTPPEIEAKLEELIERCARGASVPELRAAILPRSFARPLIVDRGDGFELRGFHFSPALPRAERLKILAAVQEALRRVLSSTAREDEDFEDPE
jgi:ParB/RepB/Spo0J family partition protein